MRKKRIDTNSRVGLIKKNQEIICFKGYNSRGRHVYNIRCNFCNHEYNSTIENFRDPKISGNCCRKCSNIQNRNYEVLNASAAQIGIVFSNYKSRSKIKNWDFTLTKEQFTNLVLKNCHYCGAKPNSFRQDRVKSKRNMDCSFLLNGLDRIDSSKGYIDGNIVTCCEDCNKAKRNLSYEQFLKLIKDIYLHLSLDLK